MAASGTPIYSNRIGPTKNRGVTVRPLKIRLYKAGICEVVNDHRLHKVTD